MHLCWDGTGVIGVADKPLDRRDSGLAAELEAWQLAVAAREAMLATMQEGIVLFEAAGDGAVRYANPAALALLGGRLLQADDLEPGRLRDAVRGAQGGAARSEVTFEAFGRTIEAVVTETGPPRSVLLVARDITTARQTEQLRRNFVANASHELKTPVSSILGLTSALERAAEDPEATRRFVGMLGREAERLSLLVSDLLDLSRLESDAGPLEPVRLDEAVLDQCEKLRGDADAGGLVLHVDGLAALTVMGLASDLGQMAHNLLANAVRYTPPGGEVRVTLADSGGTALLRVADTGIGIPAADIDRVFERFYRVDVARDRETGGTGLGLAIVRHVAETHGGQVAAASEIGSGSVFTVQIPLAEGG
ncbi:MAG: two-component system, OmpR family, sensor histidine kinase SenX3 [Gaiellales bacterium]|nr:two-component system, OmpR family, sensor histidine kinase SenX3 [Gaiellales bacterium]